VVGIFTDMPCGGYTGDAITNNEDMLHGVLALADSSVEIK
jgi:hypothetical protein